MKKEALIHGGLLVAALLLAYFTWTKSDEVKRDAGKEIVWKHPADSVTQITYADDKRTNELIKKDGQWWGKDTRGLGTPKESVAEYPVSRKEAESLQVGFSEMRALTDLGIVDEARKSELGLDKPKSTITVTLAGQNKTLQLGEFVSGGVDYYALDESSGKAYAIVGKVINSVKSGKSTLAVRKLHYFDSDDMSKIVFAHMGKVISVVRSETTNEQGKKLKIWADEKSPDKADQTLSNFVSLVEKMRPTEFKERLPGAALLMTTKYVGPTGTLLETMSLYKLEEPQPPKMSEPKPGDDKKTFVRQPVPQPSKVNFYIQSETTRMFGKVTKIAAEKVEQNLAGTFGVSGAAGTTPPSPAPPAQHGAHGPNDGHGH